MSFSDSTPQSTLTSRLQSHLVCDCSTRAPTLPFHLPSRSVLYAPDTMPHNMTAFPPHFSPHLSSAGRSGFDFQTSQLETETETRERDANDDARQNPPPSIISPAFTPPATPGVSTPSQPRPPRSIPVDTSVRTDTPRPDLLPKLPKVECEVRARIPTTTGHEMWLHVYRNSVDTKEHLAIVFGSQIRSRSLDAERPGETELDRMTRGAYVGRLYPGQRASPQSASPTPTRRMWTRATACCPQPRHLRQRMEMYSWLLHQNYLSSAYTPNAILARRSGLRAATAVSSSTKPRGSWPILLCRLPVAL
jgi:hypothetical protein